MGGFMQTRGNILEAKIEGSMAQRGRKK